MKLLKRIRSNNIILLLTVFLFSNHVMSSFIFIEDNLMKNKIKEFNVTCLKGANIINWYPHSLGRIIFLIDKNKRNYNNECQLQSKYLIKEILNSSYLTYKSIGFQSAVDDLYIQNKGYRYKDEANIFFDTHGGNKNFIYKIRLVNNLKENNSYAEEAFVAYRTKNIVYKIGKVSKWWSSSDETSLILSNVAEPQIGITISNYIPITPKISIIKKIIGNYDYSIFFHKLDKNRHIPNALLMGNRLSILPSKDLSISFMRAAQFGGDGRAVDLDVFKNLILGKDTTSSKLDYSDQPGNQIAGIDFIYKPLKKYNFEIFGQYYGEDGLDPIIDDRWIGAIFPSKRFGSLGMSLYRGEHSQIDKYTIEHINTDSGYKNVTYNHSIYQSGYRYKELPIGANIDADSHSTSIKLEKKINELTRINYKISRAKINQNNSLNNYLSVNSFDINFIEIKFNKIINKNYSFEAIFLHRDKKSDLYKKNNFFLTLKYNF